MAKCLIRGTCPDCKGSGEGPAHPCKPFNGTGEMITNDDDGNEIAVTCEACGGTGDDYTCLTCKGTGEI